MSTAEAKTPPKKVLRAKLFANGRSQAVRLPKELRMPGTEVLIYREGARVIMEPLTARGWPEGLWARIDALGQGEDDSWEWERPADPVPAPIEHERELP